MLASALAVYVVVMFAVSFWARGRINNAEDFLVAGRRLPLFLAWPTLFATWFGAGTLLTATDEVRVHGLERAGLDPFGAGVCLLIAGAFYARPLWKMQLLTLGDFYRKRFGPRAELVASLLMVPGYTGWIAAQFVALAGVLNLFFGLDVGVGIALVALVGMGYTLIGGMWSVTLTDAMQIAILLIGLVALSIVTFSTLGDGDLAGGWSRLLSETPPKKLVLVPTEKLSDFVKWTGVFCAGALGNIPGQDLMQRVFASRSARVASYACVIAGLVYLTFGTMPLLVGLGGTLLFPEATGATILPFLAQRLLSPGLAVIFLLAVVSAVLSTVDSAILSPASVLAQNVLSRIRQERFSALQLNQLSILLITVVRLVAAYMGEDAYSLLESAYEIGVVSLLVPLSLGLFTKGGSERAALVSMVTGTTAWAVHQLLGWDAFLSPALEPAGVILPAGLSCAALGAAAYAAATRSEPGLKMDSPGAP
jgi:Na+/proline symporter